MALVIIYAVLSHFDFVAKFTVKNLNKDFTNTGRGGGGGPHFLKVFYKNCFFLRAPAPPASHPLPPRGPRPLNNPRGGGGGGGGGEGHHFMKVFHKI